MIPAPPTTTRPRLDLRANAAAALAAVLLGASVVAVRFAVREVPPVSLAVLRFGQGFLLLALLGAVFFAAFPVSFNTGLRHTEASRGALMLATMPIWSALLGRIAGEGLGGHQLAGVGLSVVGIGLAFAEPGWAAGGTAALLGDGLLLLTGLLGAVYGLLAKRALAQDGPATVTAYAMLFGTLLLLPWALVEGLLPAVGRLHGQILALVVFVGVPGGAVAFLLWTWALSRLSPTRVAVYVNLNPMVAAVLGVLLVTWPGRRRAAGRGEPRAGGGFARPGTAGAPPRPTGELPLDPPDSSARPPEGTA